MLNKPAIAMTLATAAGLLSFSAFSQTNTDIQSKQESSGYAQDVRGTIMRNQFGLCWRTGYWMPGDAEIGCDGQLEPPVAKATAPAIVSPTAPASSASVASTPAAPPVPLPPKRCDFTVTLTNDQAFAFNKTSLNQAAKKRIDGEVLGKLAECARLDLLEVTGHSDSIGPKQYNLALSQKRAAAVASYLKIKGVTANIKVVALGDSDPIQACDTKLARKRLSECLSPNRRVVIQAQGPAK